MKYISKLWWRFIGWTHAVKNRHEFEPIHVTLDYVFCRCGLEAGHRIHGGNRPWTETPTYRNF